MTPTTPSPPTVVKWPFFVGDGLCIAATATILALAERPLSGGVTAAAVVCLLVGMGLAIVPYLIEGEARLRVAEASAHASIDIQIRKAAGFAEQLNHSVSRSQTTAEQIERVLASNEESMEKLTEQVESIAELISGDGPPRRGEDPELAKSLRSVETELHKLSQVTTDLAGREHLTPDRLQEALAELNRKLDKAFDRLNKASTDTRFAPVPTDPVDPPRKKAPKTAEIGPSKTGPATQAVQAENTESPNDSSDGKHERKGRSTPVSPDDSHPEKPPEVEGEPRFTFNEKSTSLIATAYIGIGNKLFLRGDGPGLSWEEGVPMQFLSIGKWGWSALDADAPITCRIYKNDDEPAIDGDIVLNPSELKELSPRF